MASGPSNDAKDPVANITSHSTTIADGHGKASSERPIDASLKTGSHVNSPSAADYTAIQTGQGDGVSHKSNNTTIEDSETLIVNPFSKLALHSILRHQQVLAGWEKRLHEQGALEETELHSLRKTLRFYCMLCEASDYFLQEHCDRSRR